MINKIFLFLIFSFLIGFSCKTIFLQPLDEDKIQKCKKCRDFLIRYQKIEALNMPYDSYAYESDAITLIDLDTLTEGQIATYKIYQDSIKNNWKANVLLFDDYNNLIQNQWCFHGLTKINIEKRFGHSFEKNFELEYNPLSLSDVNQERCFMSYTLTTGIYDKNKSEPVANSISSGNLFFTFDIINGDTICNAGNSSIHFLKKCFEVEGIKYKAN